MKREGFAAKVDWLEFLGWDFGVHTFVDCWIVGFMDCQLSVVGETAEAVPLFGLFGSPK